MRKQSNKIKIQTGVIYGIHEDAWYYTTMNARLLEILNKVRENFIIYYNIKLYYIKDVNGRRSIIDINKSMGHSSPRKLSKFNLKEMIKKNSFFYPTKSQLAERLLTAGEIGISHE